MITRWIIIDDETGQPVPRGFLSEKEAWAEQVRLARALNRSPYEWTAYSIDFKAI